jgi:hypothetical protein
MLTAKAVTRYFWTISIGLRLVGDAVAQSDFCQGKDFQAEPVALGRQIDGDQPLAAQGAQNMQAGAGDDVELAGDLVDAERDRRGAQQPQHGDGADDGGHGDFADGGGAGLGRWAGAFRGF